MRILLATYIIIGVVMIIVAIPLIRRWIKPNLLYGSRLPHSAANTALWYDITSYSGRLLTGIGVATILAAVLCYVLNFGENAYTLVCTVVMLMGILTMVALGLRRMIVLTRQ
jgi:hypothetical protein